MAKSQKSTGRRAATLSDVGRAAGVSAMAASAVINKTKTSARISEETRQRILAAAKELRYRPNVAARALAQRRMNTIGVAIVVEHGELNTYFLDVFNGIIDAAATIDQNTTVFTLHGWKDSIEQIGRCCDGRIDGMILIAPVLTPEEAEELPSHTPFVTLHANTAIPGSVNLESDEEEGVYKLIQYLIGMGHSRILHLTGPRGLIGVERRIRGYQRALQDNGIPPDTIPLLTAKSLTGPGGLETMEAWFEAHKGEPLPEAIFCSNDSLAVACIEFLALKGVSVPGDVSVCGFDDSQIARTTIPQLTTVRQPLKEMGKTAVEILLKRIDEYQLESDHNPQSPVVFPTELVRRGSTGAPGGTRAVPS